MVRIAENTVAAYYDAEVSRFMQKAAEFAQLADKASNPEDRQKRWAKATEYFQKAHDALENAKNAASV
jgi:hypothetical protein